MHVLTILNEDLLNTLLGSSDGRIAKPKAQRHRNMVAARSFRLRAHDYFTLPHLGHKGFARPSSDRSPRQIGTNHPRQHRQERVGKEQHPEHHQQLPAFYQAKRDLFCALLQGSRFAVVPSQGTYFQLLGYDAISAESDVSLARRWTCEQGIASIPISVFYQNPEASRHRALRFCFAKDDDTLAKAADILCRL